MTSVGATDGPEWMPLYRKALGRDRFVGRWCARCGHERTAWADGQFGIALRCPRCLRERVRALRETHGPLPRAVAYLEKMANDDLRKQSIESRRGLTVDFDVFARCDRCERVILRKDARCRLASGQSSSPPYCLACYAELEAGDDG